MRTLPYLLALLVSSALVALLPPEEKLTAAEVTPADVLQGLKSFWQKTALPDGSFRPGIDPEYQGMSDSAFSDLAPVTYAVTLHKTFGLQLPNEEKTLAFLHSRQGE